jgi:hypothetical protein
MCDRYKAEADRLHARNAAVLQRFHAAQEAQQQTIPSDDDGDDGGDASADPQHQQPGSAAAAATGRGPVAVAASGGAKRQAVQVCSPRLEGLAGPNSPGLAAGAADGFDLLMEEDDSLDS